MLSAEFAALIEYESISSLRLKLSQSEIQLARVRSRLFNAVYDNYKSLDTASLALQRMHDRLETSLKDFELLVSKIANLRKNEAATWAPEFEELAVSLQDNLSQSLHTLWIEPMFSTERIITKSPTQWPMMKLQRFDPKTWVDVVEDLTNSLAADSDPDMRTHFLNYIERLKIDEYALPSNKLHHFASITQKLADDAQLIEHVLAGYGSYVVKQYLQPLQTHLADSSTTQELSSSTALALFTILSLRIILDLQKLQGAMNARESEAYHRSIVSFCDTFLSKNLLAACTSTTTITTAGLYWYIRLATVIRHEFPTVCDIQDRCFAHTVCHIVYSIWKKRGLSMFTRLIDITSEDRTLSPADTSAELSVIRQQLLSACANSSHRRLVGEVFYTYTKSIWIGFLFVSGFDLDYDELLIKEIASAQPPTDDIDLTPPLAADMLDVFESIKQMPRLDSDAFSNSDRATYIDAIETLTNMEVTCRNEALKFGLDNWSCKHLSGHVRSLQHQERCRLSNNLARQLEQLIRDGMKQTTVLDTAHLQSIIVEPATALIAQVNYFCAGSTAVSEHLLRYLRHACENQLISSLRIEARVRMTQDVHALAQKPGKYSWRQQLVLDAYLTMLALFLKDPPPDTGPLDKSRAFLLWTLLRISDLTVPESATAKGSECLLHISGMMNGICISGVEGTTAAFDEALRQCEDLFGGSAKSRRYSDSASASSLSLHD